MPTFATLLLAFSIAVQGPNLSPKQIYEQNNDAVVTIVTDRASGSGFFVLDGSTLVTCAHVLEGAKTIEVQGTHGRKWSVASMAADVATDVAVLKLSADSKQRAIAIGDPSKLTPGDPLVVIGNPLGILEGSITSGILSAKRFEDGVNYLQTTVPISHGNSGGPLLNGAGEAVGIVSLTLTEGQNLNLAISFGTAKPKLGMEQIGATQFFAKAPGKTATEATEKKETSSKALATSSYAKWFGRVAKDRIRSLIAYHNAFARDTRSVMQTEKETADTYLATILDFNKLGVDSLGITQAESDAIFTSIEAFYHKAIDRCRAEAATNGSRSDIKRGNEKSFDTWLDNLKESQSQFGLEQLCFEDLRKTFGANLDAGQFEDELPSSVFGKFIGTSAKGVWPDVSIDDHCVVGYCEDPHSKFQTGTIITAVGLQTDSSYTPIKNWKDVWEFIRKRFTSDVADRTILLKGKWVGEDVVIRVPLDE